jgi:nitrogen regulatory protein PII
MTTRDALSPMTKIEVVVTGSDVAAVGDVLTTCGATGYTVLSGVSGLGHHGFHQGRLHFYDRDTLRMVLTVVPDDRADPVIDAIRALLADRPGVLFVSDTYVSRPEYFT